MIGREWERRKAWSGPALIRRGPDFMTEMPKAHFLLYSFEGSILTYSAGQIFLGEAEGVAELRRVPTTTHRKIWTS